MILPDIIRKLPGYPILNRFYQLFTKPYSLDPFLSFAPPGHFYSPIPDLKFVEKHKTTLFARQIKEIPGVRVNGEEQSELIRQFSSYYGELPFKEYKSEGLRYYFENPFFSYGDAIILYSMLRHYRPQRVIEIGSGYSSAVMLDTNDLFFGKDIKITFVEPHPERLYSLLQTEEGTGKNKIILDMVQNVPLDLFATLKANDILFIDSSHVAKIGSDVVHLLANVLPSLNNGVIIHFHDIFWPFEYPEEWIREGRAWNEDYFIRAFLQFNHTFKIVFFNSYLAIHHMDVFQEYLPLFLRNTGGSLWIQKTS